MRVLAENRLVMLYIFAACVHMTFYSIADKVMLILQFFKFFMNQDPILFWGLVTCTVGVNLLPDNIKDSAYFFYCACVLCISGYSGFLWVVPTNTEIFLCGLKLCRESRT